MTPKAVLLACIVLGAAVIAWDVVLWGDDVPENTISSVIGGQHWALSVLGFVAGHFVSLRRKPAQLRESATAGVVSVAGGQVIGDPLAAIALGFAGGMVFWPNRRQA